MSRERANKLLSKSVSEGSVRPNGRYTIPRTYGVYRVRNQDRPFRFGNHPVREWELDRECGGVERITLLHDREDAKELAYLLNAGTD